MVKITDQYNRTFKVLRVSLINRCNLGCIYCTEYGDNAMVREQNLSPTGLPTPALMKIIRQLHGLLDLETIRFTGGEPLLYQGLPAIIEGTVDAGISDIKLTTNGMLLERKAAALRKAGLRSVNVSLDAMDPAVFFQVNKRDGLQKVLAGIAASLDAGLDVKINAVILKGINDREILPLLEYAFSKNLIVRFLEVMAMGHLHKDPMKYFFSQDAILERVAQHYPLRLLPRKPGSTSNYWIAGEGHKFGIIANESSPFCHDCNRLRLDSEGRLFGCLSNNNGIQVSGYSGEEMVGALQKALAQKQSLKFIGSELSMLQIGG